MTHSLLDIAERRRGAIGEEGEKKRRPWEGKELNRGVALRTSGLSKHKTTAFDDVNIGRDGCVCCFIQLYIQFYTLS